MVEINYFEGRVAINPPLNQEEFDYLVRFAETRRMERHSGPYTIGTGFRGQGHDPDVISYNTPPRGQPSLWCEFHPITNEELGWTENEGGGDATEWIRYLIDHFLKPGAEASKTGDPRFKDFTFDHVCDGEIIEEDAVAGGWRPVARTRVTKNVVTGAHAEHTMRWIDD